LVYALAANSAIGEPTRWYLSPMLHTPAFLDSIPRGVLQGARGVAPGTVAGGREFRARFSSRWQDTTLDDAPAFYDAGALAVLALQRAIALEGTIPEGTSLAPHLIAVTKAGGTPVRWDDLGRGLQLLRQGQEIEYIGVSGAVHFDEAGQSRAASTKWWVLDQAGPTDIPRVSDCAQQ
jgi:branched-chain amino acid transport system substrate-binding protein